MQQQDMRTFRRHARFERLVSLFERDEIEDAVDALIAALDARSPDTDLEPDGDELDGNGSEDDFMLHPNDYGAGCPIADPGEPVGDEEDGDFAEDEESARAKAMKDGPGCVIADPDKSIETEPQDEMHCFGSSGRIDDEEDGFSIRRQHRDRIRETRCDIERIPVYGGGFLPPRYVLRTGGARFNIVQMAGQ